MENYLQALKKNKLKITPKRKAVISLFLKAGTRMGPYDIYNKLKQKLPKIGLPTIYRILDELEKTVILVQSLSQDRQLYYALCDSPGTHHHHFVCRKCKKVKEINFCNFRGISNFIKKNLKAKVETHHLEIEGICSRCK
jgi:Fur family zinc uptake transcriptional regulator/Fur family ferric uptake transcriptional regulator